MSNASPSCETHEAPTASLQVQEKSKGSVSKPSSSLEAEAFRLRIFNHCGSLQQRRGRGGYFWAQHSLAPGDPQPLKNCSQTVCNPNAVYHDSRCISMAYGSIIALSTRIFPKSTIGWVIIDLLIVRNIRSNGTPSNMSWVELKCAQATLGVMDQASIPPFFNGMLLTPGT